MMLLLGHRGSRCDYHIFKYLVTYGYHVLEAFLRHTGPALFCINRLWNIYMFLHINFIWFYTIPFFGCAISDSEYSDMGWLYLISFHLYI